jgi:S-adenosylmethionine:tRNA ribosyltransferase-isomerase
VLKCGKKASVASEGVTVRPVGREDDKVVVELRRGEKVLDPPEVFQVCERAGETPLPPYIHRKEGERRSPLDRERYQTVYARQPGAVAAPTAGLHFTEEILRAVGNAGASIVTVTLHVGHGTFKPLTGEAYARSSLHPEWFSVEAEAGRKILQARKEGRRVISVGTTTLRAIESFLSTGRPSFQGKTEIFIKPGYTFRGVDALITNFHLPRSSLLCLVSAFAGRELILQAYEAAIREGYRFYSYGDAMLIL